MPQFNSADDMLPNHGVPAELVDYRTGLFSPEESRQLMEKLIKESPWQERSELIHGKEVFTPRLTAWFGDTDLDYSLTGKDLYPMPWTPELLKVKELIEPFSGVTFDSMLLDYYRDGNDSVGWHNENDGVPGKKRVFAAVSLGHSRMFDIRNLDDHSLEFSLKLEDGSFLLMKGGFQENWQYRIPKMKGVTEPRISLTFRSLHYKM